MTAPDDRSLERYTAILASHGPVAAVDDLISELLQSGDYHSLFYALLMKARVKLGVSPFPTGPSADLPEEAHEPYEEAIRAAAREVGALHLAKNDLPRAWGFYRLIGEPQPVKDALDSLRPSAEDDIYPILDIAWQQKVHPSRGFDLLLERNGICSAITTLGGTDLSGDVPLRLECIRKLIAALHEQLLMRLNGEPLRGESLGEGEYHIDVSHLSSVAQMSLELLPQDTALPAARDLCDYGHRLAPGLRGSGDAPFEETYADYARYLAILAGEEVEAGLAHFEAKIPGELADGNTFPAEVFINLLVRLDRLSDALAAAKRHLSSIPPDTALTCPDAMELARRVGDYAALADSARAKGDAVAFLASRIAAGQVG